MLLSQLAGCLPNYELFDIDRYDINVSSTSGIQNMGITVNGSSNSTVITVAEDPSNVCPSTTFSLTISARNRCGENGPAANALYTLSTFWHLPLSTDYLYVELVFSDNLYSKPETLITCSIYSSTRFVRISS